MSLIDADATEKEQILQILQKWDPKKREYEPYAVPADWRVSCYEDSMEAVVNCARCGKRMIYGDGYTSRQIHNKVGFGFTVCERCYEEEWREEE